MPEGGKVLFMNKPKRFTLEEARGILPLVREATEAAVRVTQPILESLAQPEVPELNRERAQEEIQLRANEWAQEIVRLGAIPKGLWLVDFDSGTGYYCWRYNEPGIDFFHGYDDGFSGRTPIR